MLALKLLEREEKVLVEGDLTAAVNVDAVKQLTEGFLVRLVAHLARKRLLELFVREAARAVDVGGAEGLVGLEQKLAHRRWRGRHAEHLRR